DAVLRILGRRVPFRNVGDAANRGGVGGGRVHAGNAQEERVQVFDSGGSRPLTRRVGRGGEGVPEGAVVGHLHHHVTDRQHGARPIDVGKRGRGRPASLKAPVGRGADSPVLLEPLHRVLLGGIEPGDRGTRGPGTRGQYGRQREETPNAAGSKVLHRLLPPGQVSS